LCDDEERWWRQRAGARVESAKFATQAVAECEEQQSSAGLIVLIAADPLALAATDAQHAVAHPNQGQKCELAPPGNDAVNIGDDPEA